MRYAAGPLFATVHLRWPSDVGVLNSEKKMSTPKKKGRKKHPPKKGTATAFCAGTLAPKKSGLSRRKLKVGNVTVGGC
jgi:hypothetical protein